MSSLLRRMQRTVVSSSSRNPPKKFAYRGRGSKLGVSNPQDKALIARLAREERHRVS